MIYFIPRQSLDFRYFITGSIQNSQILQLNVLIGINAGFTLSAAYFAQIFQGLKFLSMKIQLQYFAPFHLS